MNEIEAFNLKLNQLESFFADIAKTNSKLVNQLHVTQKKINENEIVEALEIEKVQLNEEIENLTTKNDELIQSNDHLQNMVEELEQRVVELQKIAASPRDSDYMRRSPRNLKGAHETALIEDQVKTLNSSKEILTKKVNEYEEEISAFLRQQHDLEKQIKELSDKSELLEEENETLRLDLMDKAGESKNSKDTSISDMKNHYEQREQKLRSELRAEMKVELQARELEMRDEINLKMEELQQSETELNRREEKIALIEQQLEMLETSNIALRADISRRNAENEALESKLEILRDEVHGLKSSKNSLEMTVRSLQNDVAAHEAIASTRKTISKSDSKELLTLQRKVKSLNGRIKLMKSNYDSLVEENASLSLQGSTSKEVSKKDMLANYSQLKRLELEVQILKADNEQSGKDWLSQADLIEELTLKIDSYEKKIATLEQEVRTLNLQKTDLNNRYDALHRQSAGAIDSGGSSIDV